MSSGTSWSRRNFTVSQRTSCGRRGGRFRRGGPHSSHLPEFPSEKTVNAVKDLLVQVRLKIDSHLSRMIRDVDRGHVRRQCVIQFHSKPRSTDVIRWCDISPGENNGFAKGGESFAGRQSIPAKLSGRGRRASASPPS
jgi:hypothetical protein